MNSIKSTKSRYSKDECKEQNLNQDPYASMFSPKINSKLYLDTNDNSSTSTDQSSSAKNNSHSKHNSLNKNSTSKHQISVFSDEPKRLDFKNSEHPSGQIIPQTKKQCLRLPSIMFNDGIENFMSKTDQRTSNSNQILMSNSSSNNFIKKPKQYLDPINQRNQRQERKQENNELFSSQISIEDSIIDIRNRSDILPTISRQNSINLKMRVADSATCLFSPSKQDTIEVEDDDEKLLVFSEDQTEVDSILNIRKELEGLDLDEVISKIKLD